LCSRSLYYYCDIEFDKRIPAFEIPDCLFGEEARSLKVSCNISVFGALTVHPIVVGSPVSVSSFQLLIDVNGHMLSKLFVFY